MGSSPRAEWSMIYQLFEMEMKFESRDSEMCINREVTNALDIWRRCVPLVLHIIDMELTFPFVSVSLGNVWSLSILR